MAKVKLVAESFKEWKDAQNGQDINEGAFDFFKGARALVKQAMQDIEKKDIDDEKKEKSVDNALKASFAKQFGQYPKIKESVLAWDLEKKKDLLKKAAKVLEDPKIAGTCLRKNADGKIEVYGYKTGNAAGHSISNA